MTKVYSEVQEVVFWKEAWGQRLLQPLKNLKSSCTHRQWKCLLLRHVPGHQAGSPTQWLLIMLGELKPSFSANRQLTFVKVISAVCPLEGTTWVLLDTLCCRYLYCHCLSPFWKGIHCDSETWNNFLIVLAVVPQAVTHNGVLNCALCGLSYVCEVLTSLPLWK